MLIFIESFLSGVELRDLRTMVYIFQGLTVHGHWSKWFSCRNSLNRPRSPEKTEAQLGTKHPLLGKRSLPGAQPSSPGTALGHVAQISCDKEALDSKSQLLHRKTGITAQDG